MIGASVYTGQGESLFQEIKFVDENKNINEEKEYRKKHILVSI